MPSDEQTTGNDVRSAARVRSHLFAVRLWKHEAAGASEYRGSVREVISGAFLNFRAWSELAAFMTAQMDDDESARTEGAEGAF
jgi:hypothetical protein